MAVEFPWRKEHQNAPGPSFVPGKPSTLPGVFCEFECMCVQGAFREEAHLACRQGGERRGGAGWGGKMRENVEQMFYNLNLRTVILQGERYLKKKKKSRMASQGFYFPCTYKP